MKKTPDVQFNAKNFFKSFQRTSLSLLKYQLLTRILISIIVIPTFLLLTQLLVSSKSGGLLTDATLVRFLLSPRGLALCFVAIGLILLGVVIEIGGFIIISSRSIHKQPEADYLTLLKSTLKLLPKLISIGSLVLIFYIVILGPLSGEILQISFLDWLKIPNFVSHVIFSEPLYLTIYIIVTIIAMIVSSLWIFSFHFLTIYNLKAHQAIAASTNLVRKNFWKFFKFNIKVFIVLIPIVAIGVLIWFSAISLLIHMLNIDILWQRSIAVGLLLIQQIGLLLATMIAMPMQVHLLTMIFYYLIQTQPHFDPTSFPEITPKTKPSIFDKIFSRKRTISLVTLALLITSSVPLAMSFDYFFKREHVPEIVGHRGAGEEAPENSLSGIKEAIKIGAQWSEIDIQRTKDGRYILNHDQTFKRVAGDKHRSTDLTLEQIQKLNLNWENTNLPHESVAEVEQVLTISKDKINLLIELKGKTADEKMVDDIAFLLQKYNITHQTAIITNKYPLIQYSKSKYPHIKTGLIYFLGLGSINSIIADYLIVEEGVANSDSFLNQANSAGKKVFVWTVNDDSGLAFFSKRPVAGIITDRPNEARKIIEQQQNQSRKDILLEAFFSGQ